MDRCLICGDRSSGIHFGLLTCEACKAFFRRTDLNSSNLSLHCSPELCPINVENRNNCPSCRYEKCRRLGMNRSKIFYGKSSSQSEQTISNEFQCLFQMFLPIYSIYSSTDYRHFSFISVENQQQIDSFYQNLCQHLFSSNNFSFRLDLLHRIFNLIIEENFDAFSTEIDPMKLRLFVFLYLFIYFHQIQTNFSSNATKNSLKIFDKYFQSHFDDLSSRLFSSFVNRLTILIDSIE